MISARVARADFPILGRDAHDGVPLVYLDSAATSQKPSVVMETVAEQELMHNGAVNRGSHILAAESTIAVEDARAKVAAFVGAFPDEISWTKNSTEALNAVAYTFVNESLDARRGKKTPFALREGDNIVVTRAEHHANLIPWQEVCRKLGVELRWLDLMPDGQIALGTLSVIDGHTRVVAFTHISNVTGAISPVETIVAAARAVGAFVVLDACQSTPHIPVDFHQVDPDFAVFSGHKMMGPTGIGALYVKRELGRRMPPFLTGGSMVELVTMEKTTFAMPPARFEAGTQPVAQIVGFGAAVDYLSTVGMKTVAEHEKALTAYTLEQMRNLDGIRILGPVSAEDRVGVIAFDVSGVHPHDVGQILDASGVAIRVGHHCAQPIHQHFGVFASSRVSFGPYNTEDDVNVFLEGLARVRSYFGVEG
ncbi:aminotransferase class V-fold PLP-dependent enzyme [Arcanobacterium haemolyticum]|uniref:cysteine desulfurase n=1 Tax=Arcanobacterium haemolyticum (strain ATCC 9345 / DSM 20595 / CCM 5947 / CCUG 17215 / LMG 16163 / NBRC 15585 / NCTC 8452 / 11018) TaxID=644284 RepID=D7BP06_ARCHD|nr:cysteine desulfurase, SufS subfamily [Arcanobacterium haemolyticum DSM 20595]SQH28608.1 Cysteine desulfurase [Arcanobacterium haemolyticum]